jgi:hypothetical protein
MCCEAIANGPFPCNLPLSPTLPTFCPLPTSLQVFDPRLGVEVQYRDYGTSCALLHPSSKTLDWSVLGPTLLDEFVVAHSLGWWAKALLIRNTGLLWTYSVAFELLELTFAVRGGPWGGDVMGAKGVGSNIK